jgi:hypothetical protein
MRDGNSQHSGAVVFNHHSEESWALSCVPAAAIAGQGPPPVPPAIGPMDATSAVAPVNPSITGTVERYLLTPVGDVEGLELEDGADVRFPPHMGAALAAIVKPGDRVSVMGFVAPSTSMAARSRRSPSPTWRPTNRWSTSPPRHRRSHRGCAEQACER